jgi:hypothetical protein
MAFQLCHLDPRLGGTLVLFSAPPLRSLRLCGELLAKSLYRRDAENAEEAQRNFNKDATSELRDC